MRDFPLTSFTNLCLQLLIAKKTELRALDPEVAEDPALLHHALSRLPRITPDSIGEPSLQAASKERGPSASEKESHGQDDTAEKSGLYADPDVYPPESRGQKDSQGTALPDIPLSKLLSEAVSLQRQFPLMAPEVGADRIMGAKSVIFTWDQLRASHRTGDDARNGSGDAVSQDDEETPLDWAAEDAAAEAIVSKTDLIVLDAHPSPPPSEAEEPIYGDDKEGDEKAGRRPSKHTKRSKLRRPASKDVAVGTVIAVMGVAGVLMAIYAGERRDSVAEIKAAVGYFGTVIGYVTGM